MTSDSKKKHKQLLPNTNVPLFIALVCEIPFIGFAILLYSTPSLDYWRGFFTWAMFWNLIIGGRGLTYPIEQYIQFFRRSTSLKKSVSLWFQVFILGIIYFAVPFSSPSVSQGLAILSILAKLYVSMLAIYYTMKGTASSLAQWVCFHDFLFALFFIWWYVSVKTPANFGYVAVESFLDFIVSLRF